MRIAIFDYKIIATNPVGGCHLRLLKQLSGEHDFVVFAVQFENPDPRRIEFVRVPVLTRPLAGLFLLYHLVAPLYYWFYRVRTGKRFDLVQTVESNCLVGNHVVYAQFCHQHFLKKHWPEVRTRNLRGALRWLDHFLHSMIEPLVFWRAQKIVVPSHGLARELSTEFPGCASKIEVWGNPIDLEKMISPADFDRLAMRRQMSLCPGDVGLLFVALGHFERKGLPLILEALVNLPPNTKLNVVGGEASLISEYRQRARQMGLGTRVQFHGMQRDVRAYMWGADLFVFPSVYETFALVVAEAMAAGLPAIVTKLNGVEDYVRDSANGFVISRNSEAIRLGVERFIRMPDADRKKVAEQARADVQQYSIPVFGSRWRDLYQRYAAAPLAKGDAVSGHRL